MTQTTTARRPAGAATARRTVTLTGVQPTGDLHLGNYVGAIRPLAELAADPARDVYVFVADLHALNGRPDPEALRERSRRLAAALLACGLDRPNVHVYRQSRVPAVARHDRPAEQRRRQGAAEPRPRLQGGGRGQRRGRTRPRPRREHGPVQLPGADGRRHPRARRRRGAGGRRPGAAPGDRRRPRAAVLAQLPARRAARAAGAHRRGDRDAPRPRRPQDEQVLRQRHPAHGRAGPSCASKSAGSSPTPRHRSSRRTPARARSSRCCARSPTQRTVAAVEARYRTGGIGYGEVKELLAEVIEAHVAPMRDRYQRLLTDPAELDARLATGEQHAARRADRTLARTMAAMGL